MRRLKNHLLKNAKLLRHTINPPEVAQRFLHKNVPYFSQWESREMVGQILDKTATAEDDPLWQTSGAATKQEYGAWSWSGCGMACTKMLLAHHTGKVTPLVILGKKCAEYGGYTMPLSKSIGLLYKPYVKFMAGEFDISAAAVPTLLPQEIIACLSDGKYVLASVSPLIREPNRTPKHKGGHLVLMLGYDLQKKEFYLHNPSGTSKETQEYATVSFDDFDKFFGGQGLVVDTSVLASVGPQ